MKEILSALVAESKMKRMALEIAERNQGLDELYLIGIRDNGMVIAARIAAYLESIFPGKLHLQELTINKKAPGAVTLAPELPLQGKAVILADDVLSSGKTMFFAMKPLLEQQPARVQVLALVARTHKQFPIAVDYVGISVSTTLQERIEVVVEGGVLRGALLH